MYKELSNNLPIILQAVNYSRYNAEKVVTFEARWRTFASMKLQNSIEASSSVSAIQGCFTKATKKASYTCIVAFISVFGFLWTIGENEKKYDALWNENALVRTVGKVPKC